MGLKTANQDCPHSKNYLISRGSELIAAFFCAAIISAANAKNIAEPGECKALEDQLFRCEIRGKKVALLCAKKTPKGDGYTVHYRFGSDQTGWFELPRQEESKKNFFTIQEKFLPGGMEKSIYFQNKGYTYRIYDTSKKVDGSFWAESGIEVKGIKLRPRKMECLNNDSEISALAEKIIANNSSLD